MRPASQPPVYPLSNFVPDPGIVRLLPEPVAREYLAVPLRVEAGELVVASANPRTAVSRKRLARAARQPIHSLTAIYPDVREALDLAYNRMTPPPQEAVAADLCMRLGILQPDHLPVIQAKSAQTGKPFLECCESLGLITSVDHAEVTALLYHLPIVRGKNLEGLVDLSGLMPWEIAQQWQIVPLCWAGNHLLVGSPQAIAPSGVREIANKVKLPVELCILARDPWEKLYRRFYLRGNIEESPDRKIAQALVQLRRLSEEALTNALSVQRQSVSSLEDVILDLNLVERREWYLAKAQHYRVSYHDPAWPLPPTSRADAFDGKLPAALARALQAVPLPVSGRHWVIGLAEPTQKCIRTIETLVGHKIEPRLVDRRSVEAYYRAVPADEDRLEDFCLPTAQEYAVCLGLVSPALLEGDHRRKPLPAGDPERLVAAGLIDDVDFAELLGLHCGIPFTPLGRVQFSEERLCELSRELMARGECFPLFSTPQQLWLVIADPLDGATIREVEKSTGKWVWPVIAPRSIIQSVLARYVIDRQKLVNLVELRVIEQLVSDGILTQIEASRALQLHASLGTPLDAAIAEQSTYPPGDTTRAIARILGIDPFSVSLQEREIPVIDPLGGQNTRMTLIDPVDGTAARLIDLEQARKWCALPVGWRQGRLIVAFAGLDYQPALIEVQNRIGEPIVPVLASRQELEQAIQRTLGRWNLGTYLLKNGLINHRQLNRALELANRTGVRLGKALVTQRAITPKQLYHFLAEQSGLQFIDLISTPVDEEIAREIPAEIARKYGIVPIGQNGDEVTLATTDPLDLSALELARKALKRPVNPVVVTDVDLDLTLERIYSHEYLEKSISELLERAPQDSAFKVLSTGQTIFLGIFLALSVVWLYFAHNTYFIFLNALATIFYLVYSGYKLYLIYRAMDQDLEIPVTSEELAALKDNELPIYSILIPVYHEAEMLPGLLSAVAHFDYPSTKLDIQVIMEEDDVETIQCFNDWNPPSHFHGVIVPASQPKTKPKACNYGLIHARGDYVVIYDAEDLPEPDQLKKVLVAFSKAKTEVVCIQSKLNYYNHDQNLLTHWFTIEYSMWFDLFLPGLNATSCPIPLGGTSNHFHRDALLEIAAWDPFNVTEDADLGVRLYKRGYKTAIVDSTTFEEANSRLDNWIRQRSRWIKGYIQTWLVHMRHPVQLWKEIGGKAFFGFQFVVGGSFFTALLNPIYWIFTTLWFVVKWQFIQQIFPAGIFYLGAICLFFGNFAFTYINVAGAMRRNYYGMVKYALLSPLYWALASIAAWRGLFQLFHAPFFWEKTDHGLHNKTSAPLSDQDLASSKPG